MDVMLPERTQLVGTLLLWVFGGRDYADEWTEMEMLDDIIDEMARRDMVRLVVIQGGATGADRIARDWVRFRQENIHDNPVIELVTEDADWDQHGKAAGPLRNQAIIDKHRPDMALALPGGRGTADSKARCKAAGIPVWEKA